MKKILFTLILWSSFCSAQTYLVYGGTNNDEFLGCLNCGKHDSNSIWNNYGKFGSKYSSTSIWNKYGTYGGKYSKFSPFNPYSSSAPIIVDKSGNFYGHLSSNKYHNKRSSLKLATLISEYWEKIAEDTSQAYDLLFK